MKRRTLINRLKGLVELSDLAHSYYTGDIDKWVGLGLLTLEEYAEYKKGWDAESYVYKAIHDAEDLVPRPDFETNPKFPKEYLALIARQAEIFPLVQDDRKVTEILRWFTERGYMGHESLPDTLGLSILGRKALESVRAAEDDYQAEAWKLEEQLKPKTRPGTIVQRVKHEIAAAWEADKAKARNEAERNLSAKYGQVIARKKELERLVNLRIREKIEPIREAMRKILEEALAKGGE